MFNDLSTSDDPNTRLASERGLSIIRESRRKLVAQRPNVRRTREHPERRTARERQHVPVEDPADIDHPTQTFSSTTPPDSSFIGDPSGSVGASGSHSPHLFMIPTPGAIDYSLRTSLPFGEGSSMHFDQEPVRPPPRRGRGRGRGQDLPPRQHPRRDRNPPSRGT